MKLALMLYVSIKCDASDIWGMFISIISKKNIYIFIIIILHFICFDSHKLIPWNIRALVIKLHI